MILGIIKINLGVFGPLAEEQFISRSEILCARFHHSGYTLIHSHRDGHLLLRNPLLSLQILRQQIRHWLYFEFVYSLREPLISILIHVLLEGIV